MIKLSCDTSKLEKQLMGLIDNIDKSSGSILEEGCNLIKARAKQLSPVDTGALRDSIDTKFESKGNKYTGYTYSDMDYALYVELGTRFVPPQPFMYPAYQENKDFFIQKLIETISKGGK